MTTKTKILSLIAAGAMAVALPLALVAGEGKCGEKKCCDKERCETAKVCTVADASACGLKTEIAMKVDGMVCGMCTAKVQRAVASIEGVSDSKIDLTTGIVRIQAESGNVCSESLAKVVRDAGYTVALLEDTDA